LGHNFPFRAATGSVGIRAAVLAQMTKAAFVEPMLLLPARKLPEGANWAYELKLDGYRALAVKTDGEVFLRSRNNKDFNARYPVVAKALAPLPDETVVDGEVVALDGSGLPSFNILQNHTSSGTPIIYYVFDLLTLAGRNVMAEPLSVRRELLRDHILPKLGEPVRHCSELNASLADVIASVKAAGLEGLVAKRLDSPYEPGARSATMQQPAEPYRQGSRAHAPEAFGILVHLRARSRLAANSMGRLMQQGRRF
jgi:ATP-dependent DNA ligase